MQWTHYDHTNKNNNGQKRLKQEARTASVGIYFFLVSLAVASTLVLIQ